jgi:sarcosine/dimethylglycine N-methyltransferase
VSVDEPDVVRKAREYYDSSDADTFYFSIWGGEDIHIGLYLRGREDTIFEASRRTVRRMAEKIMHLPREARVLDIGAGYGGSARYLVEECGWQAATALNISPVQNERDRQINAERGLTDKIEVIDGSFEDLPMEDGSYDLVWCQDSILHSSDRRKVFQEVDRVLKPGGEFIFTDPMQRGDADKETLAPVLARIHLDDMGSIPAYQGYARDLGWTTLGIEDLSLFLPTHYGRVLGELESREAELTGKVSEEYIANMKKGLRHWVDTGHKGVLTWGILHFRKGDLA